VKSRVLVGAALLAIAQATTPAGATETITYSYDELGRLISSSSSGTVNNNQTVAISYDAADNRSNFAVTGVPTPTLNIGNATNAEGSYLNFPVTLSPAATGTVTVNYATSNGTAVAPGDYNTTSGTLNFSAGQTSNTVWVLSVDDTAAESNETLTVTLSSPTGATIGTATGTGTINDNDTSIATLSIGNTSATEGGSLGFTVTRTGNTASAVSASYASASGIATTGSDFTGVSGTVNFAANQTTASIPVSTINDTTVESAETMTVTLSAPSSGAVIGTATGTGTITDDDAPPATLAIGNATIAEGGSLSFTVTRGGNATTAVSASYTTASGTAISGSDFNFASNTVNFAANQTTASIPVSTIDDTAVEVAEQMSVTLSNPVGATITTASGTGTITDNDGGAILTVDNVTANEGDNFFFWVYRSGDLSSTIQFNYATVSGSATVGVDVAAQTGTKTFAPNETQKLIAPSTTNDTLVEGTETFTVAITNITGGATINNANPVGTILDND